MNLLWNGGSTLSFITFQQAKRLNLIGEKVRIEIVKVGGVVEQLESLRYNLTLLDKAGLAVNVTVLGIERISSDIKAINVDGVTKLFEHVSTQDIDRPNEGQINCLIGYEYMQHFIQSACKLWDTYCYFRTDSEQLLEAITPTY